MSEQGTPNEQLYSAASHFFALGGDPTRAREIVEQAWQDKTDQTARELYGTKSDTEGKRQ